MPPLESLANCNFIFSYFLLVVDVTWSGIKACWNCLHQIFTNHYGSYRYMGKKQLWLLKGMFGTSGVSFFFQKTKTIDYNGRKLKNWFYGKAYVE